MVIINDSEFSERNKLLVKTVIAYARDEVPFSYVRHVIEWGTLPQTANGIESWAKLHVS